MPDFTSKNWLIRLALAAAAIILLAGAVTVASLAVKPKPTARAQSAGPSGSSTSSGLQSSPTAGSNTASPSVLSAAHTAPASKTACSVLTAQIAAAILGSDAKPSAATVAPSQTTDVTTNSCAYAGAAGQLGLVAHFARTSLGQSKNDLIFGSERPATAVSISGVGQSAFWDPSSSQLNVLSSNNWYIITWNKQNRSVSMQQVQQAATTMAHNF